MIGFKIHRSIPTSIDLNGPYLSYTTQPVGITTNTTTVSYGAIVTSEPTGTGHLSYQWYEVGVGKLTDGANITGSATTAAVGGASTLTLSNLSNAADTGRQFYVEASYVSSAYGSSPITAGTAKSTGNAINAPLKSDTVGLLVRPQLSFTTQPESLSANVSNDANFTVVAAVTDDTTEDIVYSWTLNGTTINDGITDTKDPSSSSDIVEGDVIFTEPGTHTWTAPEGVTAVAAIAIGGGGGGSGGAQDGGEQRLAGGGGGLGWNNNITVVPGQSYTVVVGEGGKGTPRRRLQDTDGKDSWFIDSDTVRGNGGTFLGGGYAGDGGDAGEGGGSSGGGGAGGYSGDLQGGGGFGGYSTIIGGAAGGGGTGLYGAGETGSNGANTGATDGRVIYGGGGGSGGTAGENITAPRKIQDDSISKGFRYSEPVGGGNGGLYGGGGGSVYHDHTRIGNGGAGGTGAVRIIWPNTRFYPSNANESAKFTVSGATTPTLTVQSNVAGINTIRSSITHPIADNSPLLSDLVYYTAVGSAEERKVIYLEEFDVNAKLYNTDQVDLTTTPLYIQPNDLSLSPTSDWNRIYSFYAPEGSFKVKITMGGAAGTGVDTQGISGPGGEGGVTTWIMDLAQQQEYVVNLGAAIWPSGGYGAKGKFGGGGSFFYRGGELLMACGGGGASGYSNGRGGGAGLDGTSSPWERNGFGLGGQGITGAENLNMFGGDPSVGSFARENKTSQSRPFYEGVGTGVPNLTLPPGSALSGDTFNLGGSVGSCTIGDYWQTQGIAPCADIGMTKVFTGADGTETSTFGVLVKRGYKAGLNYQWNAGYGQGNSSSDYAVGGGGGARGGSGGGLERNIGGGGGGGYNSGEFTGSSIVSNTQGGNALLVGYIKIVGEAPGGGWIE